MSAEGSAGPAGPPRILSIQFPSRGDDKSSPTRSSYEGPRRPAVQPTRSSERNPVARGDVATRSRNQSLQRASLRDLRLLSSPEARGHIDTRGGRWRPEN